MRTLIALGVAALVALAAPAAGVAKHGGKGAKVYRATLSANDAATAAGVPDVRGKAQLVDGRKRDKVSLHVRGLTAGETYLWHVHQATGEGDPCTDDAIGGPPYPAFPWADDAEVVANEDGNVNAKSRSKTFPLEDGDTGEDYYVNVHTADGTVIACGVLERKRHKSHGRKSDDKPADEDHGRQDGDKRGHAQGRGHEDHGNGKGSGHDRHDHGDD
jgi:cytochrome c5